MLLKRCTGWSPPGVIRPRDPEAGAPKGSVGGLTPWLAGAASATAGGVIVSCFADASWPVLLPLVLSALAAVSSVLVRGLILTREVFSARESGRSFATVHIVAHAVPVGYLVASYSDQVSLTLNLYFLLPLLAFFYSGRRMWTLLFARFSTMMYRFFVFGNSGMMSGLVLSILFGLYWPESVGPRAFEVLVRTYFCVHFMLAGVAILRVEADLRRDPVVPPSAV